MTSDDDRDLKDAFGTLGRVRAKKPSFDQLVSREALNAARWRQRGRQAVLLAVAVAIPTFLILHARTDRALDYERFTAQTGIDLNEVTWEAPSDFLLDFPGRELLRRVPLVDIATPALPPDTSGPPDSSDTRRRSRS